MTRDDRELIEALAARVLDLERRVRELEGGDAPPTRPEVWDRAMADWRQRERKRAEVDRLAVRMSQQMAEAEDRIRLGLR